MDQTCLHHRRIIKDIVGREREKEEKGKEGRREGGERKRVKWRGRERSVEAKKEKMAAKI